MREKVASEIRAEIQKRIDRLGKLDLIPGLDKVELPVHPSFCGEYFDFDYLTHPQTIHLIGCLGGKWEKTLSSGGTINYETMLNGVRVRVYSGEPPPSCRVIMEDVVIPAQPERIEKRRKIVCTDEAKAAAGV